MISSSLEDNPALFFFFFFRHPTAWKVTRVVFHLRAQTLKHHLGQGLVFSLPDVHTLWALARSRQLFSWFSREKARCLGSRYRERRDMVSRARIYQEGRISSQGRTVDQELKRRKNW